MNKRPILAVAGLMLLVFIVFACGPAPQPTSVLQSTLTPEPKTQLVVARGDNCKNIVLPEYYDSCYFETYENDKYALGIMLMPDDRVALVFGQLQADGYSWTVPLDVKNVEVGQTVLLETTNLSERLSINVARGSDGWIRVLDHQATANFVPALLACTPHPGDEFDENLTRVIYIDMSNPDFKLVETSIRLSRPRAGEIDVWAISPDTPDAEKVGTLDMNLPGLTLIWSRSIHALTIEQVIERVEIYVCGGDFVKLNNTSP